MSPSTAGRLHHVVGEAWMRAADRRSLVDCALAIGHAVDDDAGIVLHAAAVHAGEFAVRPFVVDPPFRRHDLALEHDLGVGGDE